MKNSNAKKFYLLAFAIILMPSVAAADIIHFKDGMKTVCLEKAWEENGKVKCEYDGVILIYQKSDVDRIEKRRTRQPSPETENKSAVSDASVASTSGTLSSPSDKTAGLRFYDPRRKHKYWTSKTDKHVTFQAAIAALAKQYDRSVDWVQSNMGETNDLEQIHRNLSASLVEMEQSPVKTTPKNTKVVEFYNPRRAHKYWTSESDRHNTFNEAMTALAKEYERPPDWVKRHMGEVNDLHAIRQNLSDRKKQEGAQ